MISNYHVLIPGDLAGRLEKIGWMPNLRVTNLGRMGGEVGVREHYSLAASP